MDFIFEDLMESINCSGNNRYTRLTEQEEAAYFDIIKTATNKNIKMAAMSKIVQNHILFVVSIAKKCASSKMDCNDLINVGILGMHRAILSYDKSQGIKFLSYAVWWIRQTIMEYCYDNVNLIRIPENQQRALSKMKAEAEKLGIHYTELLSKEKQNASIRDADNAYCPVSMDTPIAPDIDIGEGGEIRTYHSVIAGTDLDYEKRIETRNMRLKKAVKNLEPMYRDVIEGYFNDDMKFREIGEITARSREHIRQIKNKALRRLNKTMKQDDYVVA